eukprot:2318263-Amphidinium_carterae.2
MGGDEGYDGVVPFETIVRIVWVCTMSSHHNGSQDENVLRTSIEEMSVTLGIPYFCGVCCLACIGHLFCAFRVVLTQQRSAGVVQSILSAMMLMLLPRASPSLASSALPHSRANGPLAMPKFDRVSTLAILSGSVAVAAAQRKCKSPAGNLLRSRAQGNDVGTEQSFDPTVQIGAMAPLGYFDPVGFCSDASEDRFKYLRAAELKHGRVAMLAALGLVVQHDVRFEGYSAIPSGIWAVQQAPA